MNITLLHHTPIEVLIKATAMPYQSKETKRLVKRVFDTRHRSVVRHGMASFLVEEVSRSLLRQISRHPHINLTVKSTRYCDMSDTKYHIPGQNLFKLSENDNRVEEYSKDMEQILDIYRKWKVYEGNKKEIDVAKLFLPLASTTDLILSGNYQALYEFIQLRSCTRAEVEIRILARTLNSELAKVMPELFENLDCKADELGYCPEAYGSCGKYPKKEKTK